MIGIDLVFIPEFQKQLDLGGRAFIQNAFSVSELKNQKTEHLAGLWAAKEAVIKAADSVPKKMADIVITSDASQKPFALVGSQKFAISISHHGEYAVAVAYRTEQ
ncbi:MAG TPA: 4'-phosphopantetheinyl transferase superfamily protein [Candidatus Saccharimonadales bacterium]|jgi:phosphopantetheine--protein transferase-like protein|nr:4'-phosphopantetheinyl transferase superfamily protein [Candidatus Saccharimonadales bacterium]